MPPGWPTAPRRCNSAHRRWTRRRTSPGSDRAPAGAVAAWQDALTAAARRLEAAWLALEEALAQEWRSWEAEVEDLRRWRRARWPLVTHRDRACSPTALYIGLVLGGYLPGSRPAQGLVEALWARWN